MDGRSDHELLQQLRSAERGNFLRDYFVLLHGLRWLPFGALIVSMSARGLGWWQGLTNVWLELALAYAGTLLIHFCWYGGGSVYAAPGRGNRADGRFLSRFMRSSRVETVVLGSIIAVWSACAAIDIFIMPPVSLTGFALAALLFAWWWACAKRPREDLSTFRRVLKSRPRLWYPAMAVIIFLISLTPLFGLVGFPPFADANVLGLALGTILVVGGVCDELLRWRYTRDVR